MKKIKFLLSVLDYFFIKNKIIGFILVLPIILIISLVLYLI
jgi:hypothetical protein